jgi:hypothetical protein
MMNLLRSRIEQARATYAVNRKHGCGKFLSLRFAIIILWRLYEQDKKSLL